MTDERRYQDDEVAEIFAVAAAPGKPRPGPGAAQGLTLAELKAIGSEVGIAPERIAEAALSLGRSRETRRIDFGMQVSAGRVVDLPRAFTDREWATLVAALRETFRARGREETLGESRHWSNGNLHAFVEPTAIGYRLRLGTVKGNALALNRLGAVGVVIGLFSLIAMLVAGEPAGEFFGPFVLGGMGAGTLAFNAIRLPAWVRLREGQMAQIAEQARALLHDPEDSSA